MAASLCYALGLDKSDFSGKIIAVEEHHRSDGNFVLNCLIADQVRKEGGLCLLAFHNSFSHYHNVGTKFGYNLNHLQEKGCVETVELFKLLNDSFLSVSEKEIQTLLLNDEQTTAMNIFCIVKNKITTLLQKKNSVTLIIDDLSDLLSLGLSLREVLSFFQYCRTLLESHSQLKILVLTHVTENDEEQSLLSAGVAHVADLIVTISSLKTGQSSDVSGFLKVNHKTLNDPANECGLMKQNLYHFKLLDRQVKIFAPGTGMSVT